MAECRGHPDLWPERPGEVIHLLRCPYCLGRQADLIVVPGDPRTALLITHCRFRRCRGVIEFPLGPLVLPDTTYPPDR